MKNERRNEIKKKSNNQAESKLKKIYRKTHKDAVENKASSSAVVAAKLYLLENLIDR
ncbi:MAG: hypothetical protein Q8O62_10145 [Aequorivita sp.]|nr:hypothetical protein [Aequorivita sp.]